MIKLLLLTTLLFSLSTHASSTQLEAKRLQLTVTIEAINYGDVHDWSNEYKLDMRLSAKHGNVLGRKGDTIGVLRGSHSKNPYVAFSKYETIGLGDQIVKKANITLPVSVLDNSMVILKLFEADFTIPVPGPCCININDDDLEASLDIDLSLGEQIFTVTGKSARINVEIKESAPFFIELPKIIREQKANLFKDSYGHLGKSTDLLLVEHILNNLN